MNFLLKSEYFALLVLSVYLFSLLGFAWWRYLVLFLLPDIGMIGYHINTKVGAATYNLTHVLTIAIGIYLCGIIFEMNLLQLAGVILLGHSSFDRMLGYGLKYPDSFKHTHLGNL